MERIKYHAELGTFPEKIFIAKAPRQTQEELDYIRANYKQGNENHESKAKNRSLFHSCLMYYILFVSSYNLCKKISKPTGFH